MTDIFISYARGSAAHAQTVGELLRGLAYGVWRDDQLPAHRTYGEVIEERLEQAKAVVVIWSAEAVKSQWVRAEADVARLKGTLVQMTLDGTVPPLPFNQVQCADLTGWMGEASAPGWRKVLASVRALVRGAPGADPQAAGGGDDAASVDRDAVRQASRDERAALGRAQASSKAQEPTAKTAAARPAQPVAPLLAVLAFDNLSGDAELTYFSDGVSEEIQETVARGADLKVIGRSSSFQFRGADKDVRHVAEALGATHVLDGSVRRSGPKVRISTQLVDCDSRTTLWSARFDRDLADIFALQDEIAAAVAAALKTTFQAAPPVGKIEPVAYEAYLKGRAGQSWANQLEDSAIAHLEEAVALAPTLAPAWAALAHARVVQARLAPLVHSEVKATRAQITEAAETALKLDPAQGLAYAALSHLEPWGAYFEREKLMRKAVAAAPGDPRTLTEMSLMLSIVGRISDGREMTLRALSVDPLYHEAAVYSGVQLAFLDRYEESQAAFAEGRERWPARDTFLISPIHFAAFKGDWERFDALAATAKAAGLDGSPAIKEGLAVGRWLRHPNPDAGKVLLERIEAGLAATGMLSFPSLTMAGRLGLVDEAFDLIERASFAYLFEPEGPLPAGWFSPGIIFDPTTNKALIDDPRFVGFCNKLGLVDYWLASRSWPDCADSVPYDFRGEARLAAGGF